MQGKRAPDFELLDQFGQACTLTSFRGQWVVLYFYPKDNTPLCTQEACAFRDQQPDMLQLGGAEVIGISQDSVDSHAAFATEHTLSFKLLSDEDLAITKQYQCWQSPDTPNREYLGIIRSTFIVNPDGIIAKAYRYVNPEGHADEIASDLRKLQGVNQ